MSVRTRRALPVDAVALLSALGTVWCAHVARRAVLVLAALVVALAVLFARCLEIGATVVEVFTRAVAHAVAGL